MPLVYLLDTTGYTPKAIIHKFNIRPLSFNFTLGKLGLKNIIYSVYSNNSNYTNDDIYNNAVNYLLPYNSEFINNNYDSNWILSDGFWEDSGVWVDEEFWID